MGIIVDQYKKNLVRRYNKEVGIPYYSFKDFEGLIQEAHTFKNSKSTEIHYYFYYYDDFKKGKIILFCPGIGPGHTSYLREIEILAKHGYKVLTLDYTGCGESGGESLASLNMPTFDIIELLNLLKLKEEIVVMGHSLGGYTSLNLANIREDIKKAVVLSGFVSIKTLMKASLHSSFITSRILKYEKKVAPEYFGVDNIEFLKTTNKKLFVIQSDDDTLVPYKVALKFAEDAHNPNVKTLRVTGRKHNPNYTDAAIKYMSETFSNYYKLIKEKTIKTDEDKINYFKDISIEKLTEQDMKMFEEIFNFIDE